MPKSTPVWFLGQTVLVLALSLIHAAALPLGAFLGNALPATTSIEQNPRGESTVISNHQNSIEETLPPGSAPDGKTEAANSKALKMLRLALTVAGLNSLALVLVLNHLRGSWLNVAGILWIFFFACMTFFPQSEVLFFLRNPWPILRLTVCMGVTVATLTCCFAAIFRPNRSTYQNTAPSKPNWIHWRSLLLVPLYVFLYLMFGYFVAWQFESVRQFYSGTSELLSFWSHMTSDQVLQRVLPLQLARGALWALLMVFLARQLTGNRTLICICTGLAVSIWMNSQLLLPNPYMPEDVRMIHMLETASCNFLYGLLAMRILIPADKADMPGTAVVA